MLRRTHRLVVAVAIAPTVAAQCPDQTLLSSEVIPFQQGAFFEEFGTGGIRVSGEYALTTFGYRLPQPSGFTRFGVAVYFRFGDRYALQELITLGIDDASLDDIDFDDPWLALDDRFDNNRGAVNMYRRHLDGFQFEQTIQPTDLPGNNDQFSSSLELGGEVLVVGGDGIEDNRPPYIFEFNGDEWELTARPVPPVGTYDSEVFDTDGIRTAFVRNQPTGTAQIIDIWKKVGGNWMIEQGVEMPNTETPGCDGSGLEREVISVAVAGELLAATVRCRFTGGGFPPATDDNMGVGAWHRAPGFYEFVETLRLSDGAIPPVALFGQHLEFDGDVLATYVTGTDLQTFDDVLFLRLYRGGREMWPLIGQGQHPDQSPSEVFNTGEEIVDMEGGRALLAAPGGRILSDVGKNIAVFDVGDTPAMTTNESTSTIAIELDLGNDSWTLDFPIRGRTVTRLTTDCSGPTSFGADMIDLELAEPNFSLDLGSTLNDIANNIPLEDIFGTPVPIQPEDTVVVNLNNLGLVAANSIEGTSTGSAAMLSADDPTGRITDINTNWSGDLELMVNDTSLPFPLDGVGTNGIFLDVDVLEEGDGVTIPMCVIAEQVFEEPVLDNQGNPVGTARLVGRAMLIEELPCPQDINGDRVTDAVDLAELLGAFAAGRPEADLASPTNALDIVDIDAIIAGVDKPCLTPCMDDADSNRILDAVDIAARLNFLALGDPRADVALSLGDFDDNDLRAFFDGLPTACENVVRGENLAIIVP
ncbi:MAG: hypothetical protein AAGI30_07865 [Planctomycetota bacterium]